MKIKNLKINAYGKLNNLDINLKDNINIIYGKNESGKSTILKFILNSFYGTSKNKKGKNISDYEKYKPWSGEDFSGKLKYELDNGNSFEIYREFNKKNPKIFNENLEDISKQFNIDKNKGNEFFYEQTKISEELFMSTSAIMQQEVKIEPNMQSSLIQKVANLVGTGDDNVSFKRAIERINRRQLDEIGTERSREKPINVITRKIEELENEKENLKQNVDIKQRKEKLKNEIKDKVLENEIRRDCLKEVKILNEKEELEKEKIRLQENMKKENEEKIKILKNNLIEIENKNKNEKNNLINKNKIKNKKIKNKLNLFFAIIILINIFQLIFIKNKLINYIFLLTVPAYLIFYIFIKNKLNKKEKNNLKIDENEIINLKNEINLLEKNKNNIEKELEKIKNNFNLKNNLEKEKIKNNFLDKLEKNELENFVNSKDVNELLEKIQNEINEEKIRLHTIDLEQKNIEEKLENLSKIEEELALLSEQYVNLKKLNESMELAKEVLNFSYEKMKNSVTPRFTKELSSTISKLTNRKIHKCKV